MTLDYLTMSELWQRYEDSLIELDRINEELGE